MFMRISNKYTIPIVFACTSVCALILIIMFCHRIDRHDFEIDGIYYKRISEAQHSVKVTYKGAFPTSYEHEYQKEVVIPRVVSYRGIDYIVTEIDQYAFQDCSGITNITIPESIWYIGLGAFDGCTNLSEVHINDLASWCSIALENVSDCTGSTPFQYADKLCLNGETLTDIVIPQEVTKINPFVFQDCDSLKTIVLHDGVTAIGKGAFYGCHNLSSIEMSENLSYIGRDAFTETAWYENLPDGVVYVGKLLYEYKGEIPQNSHIVVKEGIETICESAFDCRRELTSLTLPTSLVTIHNYAFNDCRDLTNIYSKAINPPCINRYYNEYEHNHEIVLYVPIGSKDDYEKAPFMHYDSIVEIDFCK